MTQILPQSTNTLNSPSHSFLHRVISVDTLSPQSSIDVDGDGVMRVVNGAVLGEDTDYWGPNTPTTIGGTIDDYLQVNIKNLSTGVSAYTDITASADNDGTALAGHYIDMGITGSGFIAESVGNISSVSVSEVGAGGTGYQVNDILTIVGGNSNGSVRVLTLSGSAVATVEIYTNGTGYTVSSDNATTTTGVGSGCKINILTLYDNSILEAGDGYLYNSGGHLLVGTDDATPGQIIKFFTGGFGLSNDRAHIDEVGNFVMQSPTGTIIPIRVTTTEKNAMTPINGMIVYDSTLNKFQGRENGSWQNLI